MKKRNRLRKRVLSVAKCIRPYRRNLFLLLVLSVCLSSCAGLSNEAVDPMMPASTEFTFEQYEVATGAGKHQTVLTGFMLGGDLAELAIVNIDKNNDRYLRIYAFSNNTWAPKIDITLRPEVLFVDVINIGGVDRLIMYEHGRLNWLDPESTIEHSLVTVPSMIVPPDGNIPHVDITRDVNGDARDDLVMPDSDGFWVFIQTTDGVFADPMKLGPFTKKDRIYEVDGYQHTPWNQSRIHEMDYNRDGRNDLVFWNVDHFKVHSQDEHGLFASVATTFTTGIVFDSDDLASLAAPYGVRRRRRDHQPTGALTGRVLHSLTDMNGDGITDLGVFSLEGGSLWGMHSTYEVHFGTPTPDGGTMFAPDTDIEIQSDGIPFGMWQHDFNHDGQVDMMFTTLKLRIFKLIGMLAHSALTGSDLRDLQFYTMEGGIYPDTPNATRKIKTHTRSKSGERSVTYPPVLIGDVNGDRHSDLLTGWGRKELRVFLGAPGLDLFARKPQKVAVTIPNNEEHTWLVDLNKDNKQDLLMYHLSTTDPHRVTLLIAR
ncbi:MAG: VCBS repeat-containing protein [Candidatus Poribacteria bacterium]|nr:VCBS repeat-containing protein [Candidatus Poribacteria bacterium]